MRKRPKAHLMTDWQEQVNDAVDTARRPGMRANGRSRKPATLDEVLAYVSDEWQRHCEQLPTPGPLKRLVKYTISDLSSMPFKDRVQFQDSIIERARELGWPRLYRASNDALELLVQYEQEADDEQSIEWRIGESHETIRQDSYGYCVMDELGVPEEDKLKQARGCWKPC